MRHIRRLRRERQFRVGRDLNIARADADIAERDPAHLRVVFGGDHDFQRRRQRAVAPDDLGVILEENGLIFIGFDPGGLITGRPHIS